jgi:hypothetical protein
MKLKVYVIDLEIPARVKRWALRIGIPIVLVGAAAVAIAATPLHTWATGDTLTAADLNGNFKALDDRLTALEAQARPPSAFHATLTTATSIPTGALTTVIFDHVDYDLAKTAAGGSAEYSPVTGAFVPKAAGVYLINCIVELAGGAPTATIDWGTVLYKNGTNMANTDTYGVGLITMSQGVTQEASLAAGDTITCAAYQNTGGPLPFQINAGIIRNSFAATRLY